METKVRKQRHYVTPQEHEEMFDLRQSGESLRSIAEKFDTTYETVRNHVGAGRVKIKRKKRKISKCVYPGLESKMLENGFSTLRLSEESGIPYQTAKRLLAGKNAMKSTIDAILKVLDIPYEEAFRR